ncbi:MAG: class I SAM-dependent methyltransferase [Deltaproteobacteria bacterium]|nr:class I SAM-dependent methyltransferase [Deltaproteobacteria bacterium]
MTAAEPTASSSWAASRGERWRDHVVRMEAMLGPVDEPLIGALQLAAPCRIADLGCGGGGTTLELLRRAPPGSVVHGFDISPALVEAARARVPPDAPGIAFAVADVAAVPPPAAPYDRLTSRFGVMFYDDPAAAFAKLAHWLTPGGRFAFAVWGRPADNPWHTMLREVVAEIIAVPPPDPDAPGPFRYADADRLLALLDRSALGELAVRDWRGALQIGGGLPAAEAAQFALAAFSVAELLAEAGAAAFDAVRRALTARFAQHEADGVVRLDACVHIVTGARPG